MTLVTHQVQGSYTAFPSRPLSLKGGKELKQFVTILHVVRKTDKFISLKCKSCFSVGAPLILGPNGELLKISAFKGTGQNDESGSRASGSKSLKNPVQLSYVPRESEETLTESPKVHDIPVSYPSEADPITPKSLAIQNLFKNWLTLLRTPSVSQVVNETLEGPSSSEISETQKEMQKKERGEILKAVMCYFLGLDATIKIPLLIFIPSYLAVNVVYGAEVSKELTPLWIFGPLIVALYIKMFGGLCALYVFSFKQIVNMVKNLPAYYLVAYNYIARGKLKEDIRSHLWQRMVKIKTLDYKEISKKKMKNLESWLVEKYLDFVESIWPYYCRTIRFLKRANLI